MKFVYHFILTALLLSFVSYSLMVYTAGTEVSPELQLTPQARVGKHLWQQKACSSCHQIFGLGGYLGPDLTNVISAPGKGREYARAFISSGTQRMPKFDLKDSDIEALIEFLSIVDKNGEFPPRSASVTNYGNIVVQQRGGR